MNAKEFIRRVETDSVILPKPRELDRWIENIDTLIYAIKRNKKLDPFDRADKLARLRLVKVGYEMIKDLM